jgi:S1-C subfamily serine protease
MDLLRWIWRFAAIAVFSGGWAQAQDMATGTGFIISPDGYILTCDHVVQGSDKIEIMLPDGRKFEAAYVAGSKERDLALLKIDAENLPVLPIGNSDEVELTDEVTTLGYPLVDELGADVSVGSGTINARRENTATPLLQMDVTLNPGNSGGPVFNQQGEVIGVAASKLDPVATYSHSGNLSERVNFAIPINEGRWLIRRVYPLGFPKAAAPAPVLTKKEIVARSKPAVVLIVVLLKDAGSSPVPPAAPARDAAPEASPATEAGSVARNEPASDPELRKSIGDFVRRFVKSGNSTEHSDRPEDDTIENELGYYKFPLGSYFDREKVSEGDLREIITRFHSKWPTRTFNVVGEVEIEKRPEYPSLYLVTYLTEYDLRNSSSEPSHGISSEGLVLVGDKRGGFWVLSVWDDKMKSGTAKSEVPVRKATPAKDGAAERQIMPGQSTEEQIRTFIQLFVDAGDTVSNADDSEEHRVLFQMTFFQRPAPLDYFGAKNVSRADIRKDIDQYHERWPVRRYTPVGKFYIGPAQDPGHYRVEYQVEFDVCNSTKRVRGLAKYEAEVAVGGDLGFSIRSIQEKVLKSSTSRK